MFSGRLATNNVNFVNSTKLKSTPRPKWRRVVFKISGVALSGNCQSIDSKVSFTFPRLLNELIVSTSALHGCSKSKLCAMLDPSLVRWPWRLLKKWQQCATLVFRYWTLISYFLSLRYSVFHNFNSTNSFWLSRWFLYVIF